MKSPSKLQMTFPLMESNLPVLFCDSHTQRVAQYLSSKTKPSNIMGKMSCPHPQ